MGTPWYIVALLPLLAHSVLSVTIEVGDSDVIFNLTQTSNEYTMYISEDNRKEGYDNINLFYFDDVTSEIQNNACGFISTGTFQYKINKVSETKYQFNVTQYFDYETQPNIYRLRCTVDNEVIVMLLNIVNYDDEPPTLTSPMCSMKENVDYTRDNTDCTCILEDPDGWLSKTTFTVINSNAQATKDLDLEDHLFEFEIDPGLADNVYTTTVHITTKRQLDYETKIFYSFNVQAKDGAGHPTTPKENVTSIIDVIDQNDQPPQWTDYFTSTQITEEQTYSFEVTAVDGDKGINAEIKYFLVSSDEGVCGEDSCISISTESGKGLIKVQAIDRDALDLTTYKFEIMAQEQDEPPYTNNISVTFFIEDIDDNSPLFMSLTPSNDSATNYTTDDPKIAEFTFYENYAGNLNGDIKIQDIDTGKNAQFNVKLTEDDSQDYEVQYTDAFMIVPTAGYLQGNFQITVKDSKYLDFEDTAWQNFQFYVHSSGVEHPTNEDDLLVKIHLLDYNDESPVFEESAYSVTVDETIKKGETIIQVKATDKDAEDAVLTHELVGADAIVKLLKIDSAEGIITVGVDNAFDYDRINPIIFQVQAIDHAKPPHVTTVPVTVTLHDINNKAPTYVVEDVIEVEENQIIGIPLNASIKASDVDTTRNLTAEIDWDKSYVTKNSIRHDSNNSDAAMLQAMQFLDLSFEKVTEDTISITLKVNDRNEINTAPDYETFDTLYLNIRITDLNTQLPEFASKMSINPFIVINIININDNAPVFTQDSIKKNRTIYEMSKAGAIVGNIEATDADVGDVVSYTCKYVVEKYDWFTCSTYGELTVTASDKIDCDTDRVEYVGIICDATDGYWHTPQNFSIYILDTNNKLPHIEVNDLSPSASVVYVYEKSDQNTVVTDVGYTDDDRDIPFHTARCSFEDSTTNCFAQFVVKDNQVLVKNAGHELDRDTGFKEYDCTVVCVDNQFFEQGEPQQRNSTGFTIKLLDINDHCPELQTFDLSVSENVKKDAMIGAVVAEDIDEGLNADIVIAILTVTRDEDDADVTDKLLFDMVKTDDYLLNDTYKQWHLVAQSDLRDYYGEYTLQLVLSDLGTPPQSTEQERNKALKEKSKLKVTVTKYNYYAPKFTYPNEDSTNLVLSTDQVPGQPLVMFLNNEKLPNINIVDGPDDTCIDKWEPTFEVTLTGASAQRSNFFAISNLDRCNAQLQVDDTYRKGQTKTYEVTITTRLSDGTNAAEAEASYTEKITLNIGFADPNGDPIFNQDLGAWNLSLLEADATLINTLPDDRKAFYQNADNFTLTVFYSLYSDDQNILDTFDVEANTGTLKLQKELDYLVASYYEFHILAARNQSGVSNPNEQSLLEVTLWVEDINNHSPEWTRDSYFGAIMKSSQKGSTIVTVEATDLDVIDKDKLDYILNGTIDVSGSENLNNIQDPFLINNNTGAILLNFQVEYNMNGFFDFIVYVKDAQDTHGNGPHYNETRVTIYIVTEDNTLTFKFENTLDTVVNYTQQVTETISNALGWDCHDYSMNHDTQNGVTFDNVTACNIYCVFNDTLLTADNIKSKLNNINTFKQVKDNLLKFGVLLLNFDSYATTVENLETTLKAALIGVSVVLGAMCIILAVTFFLKARELNRRLKHLTEPKFGSDESNINRTGINAPNTNVFAVEGSNPVFSNETRRDDYVDYDKRSIRSGDSDLIGVEDSPEFDAIFAEVNKQKF